MDLTRFIMDVPNFPTQGVQFKDLTPLFQNPVAFGILLKKMAVLSRALPIDIVAGIESRGFILGAALADRLNVGFVPIRKKGKLPRAVVSQEYQKEYGSDAMELHKDAVRVDQHVLIVDDLLATGGTALAAARLVEQLHAKPRFLFAVELGLGGRERLAGYDVVSVMRY